MSNPSILKGQRLRTTIITRGFGRTRQGLVSKWGFTPKVSAKSALETGNERPGKFYNIHEGAAVDIEGMLKNERHLLAAIYGRDPATTALYMDQKRQVPFSILTEVLAEDEKQVIAAALALECLAEGVPTMLEAADASKLSIKAQAKEVIETNGIGIAYVRIKKSSTPAQTIPPKPVLTEAAGTTDFAIGDVIHVQMAQSNTAHIGTDPAPSTTDPLTPPCGVVSIPVAVATDKIVATFAAIGAGKSYAIYVGRTPESCVFYKWVAAAGTTVDITVRPDLTMPAPIQQDLSGVHSSAEDHSWTSVVEGATTYGIAVDLFGAGLPAPIDLEGWGLPYFAILKNGLLVPSSIDTASAFGFTDTRKTFFSGATPGDSDVVELFYPYQGAS